MRVDQNFTNVFFQNTWSIHLSYSSSLSFAIFYRYPLSANYLQYLTMKSILRWKPVVKYLEWNISKTYWKFPKYFTPNIILRVGLLFFCFILELLTKVSTYEIQPLNKTKWCYYWKFQEYFTANVIVRVGMLFFDSFSST